MIVVIPCGGKKLDKPAPAHQLYIGPYFRACWEWANSIAYHNEVFILSAKYGLIKPDYCLRPYDLRMGDKHCVDADEVREDAEFFGILGEKMIGLGGKDYIEIMRQVWPEGKFPITGLSLGHSLSWLKNNKGKKI